MPVPAWEQAQKTIRDFLGEYLFVIEQRYGDCRAPFAWPPVFRLRRRLLNTPLFVCELSVYDDDRKLSIAADRPEDLPEKVHAAITGRFGDVRPE